MYHMPMVAEFHQLALDAGMMSAMEEEGEEWERGEGGRTRGRSGET